LVKPTVWSSGVAPICGAAGVESSIRGHTSQGMDASILG
jgi:hypothetical protein